MASSAQDAEMTDAPVDGEEEFNEEDSKLIRKVCSDRYSQGHA